MKVISKRILTNWKRLFNSIWIYIRKFELQRDCIFTGVSVSREQMSFELATYPLFVRNF